MIKNKEINELYKKILIIICLYIIIEIILCKKVLYANILNELFWIYMFILLVLDIKKSYIRFNQNKKYYLFMIIISSIYTIIYFYIGFATGFLKSPYNHEIITTLKNIILKIIPITSIEITRCIIALRNKKNKFILIILTIILALAEFNYNTLINLLNNRGELFKYICSVILPIITNSILYTYLTLQGSYKIILIYRFYKEIIILLLPIIPDMNWFITGGLNILTPITIYVIFKYKFIKNYSKKRKQIIIDKLSYTVTIIMSIIIICFMAGAFKYEPIVIASDSMSPFFNKGEIVIYKKQNKRELKELSKNDIIVYTIDNQNIVHRIVNIVKEKNIVLYKTKGDNNNIADSKLVKRENIKGKYIFHIKYIGFLSIWLHEFL